MKLLISFVLVSILPALPQVKAANTLEQTLEQRISGDRSGVCVAVARIGESTETAFYCADPQATLRLDQDARFEIGSLSKVMQGVLLVRLVEQGKLALDEPLADLLPAAVEVPRFGERPIRLLDLLTHTSGLPALPADLLEGADPANPYASLTADRLLAALEAVELSRAPGEAFEYSNFGAMLLSLAMTQRTGQGLDQLLHSELFEPLGMNRTSLSGATVQGHNALGRAVSNWDLPVNLAGVGGLRSTLPDMIRWMEASQGRHDGPLAQTFARAREVLVEVSGESIGWGWMHIPVAGRSVIWHNGGTGGFTASAAFDPATDRSVIVLADTGLTEYGGLDDLALHLLDQQVPLRSPRLAATLPEGVNLADYTGTFDLFDGDEPFMGGFELKFFTENNTLMTQASTADTTQPPVALDAEGRDHFSQAGLQLEIRFLRDHDGDVDALDFSQAGLKLRGRRR